MTWQKEKPEVVDKINELIKDCLRDPFKGIGKPEPLVGNLTGFWSRRISHEHRLVYMVERGSLYIIQCRWHY
jgi:toxin YoeB